ncbi:MAG: phosphatase PAP2 family protein [Dehalococcoidales bacterium]|nr:phosphatase PAP2 family protein [Dehalococcoidales bacterium]
MRRFYIVAYISCLVLFGLLGYFAHRFSTFPGDTAISLWLQAIDLPFLNSVMHAVSYIASPVPAVIIVTLVSGGLWAAVRKLESILIASLTGGSALINWLLKLLISRPRPDEGLVQVLGNNNGSSFPSAHAVYAVAFYGLLFYLAPGLSKRRAVVGIMRSLLILLILLTAVSRIYLGAHWPSDVLGGLLLGGLLLTLAVVLYHKYDGGENA